MQYLKDIRSDSSVHGYLSVASIFPLSMKSFFSLSLCAPLTGVFPFHWCCISLARARSLARSALPSLSLSLSLADSHPSLPHIKHPSHSRFTPSFFSLSTAECDGVGTERRGRGSYSVPKYIRLLFSSSGMNSDRTGRRRCFAWSARH